MWSEHWLVLSTKHGRDPGSEATEYLVFCIDDVPGALDALGVSNCSAHDSLDSGCIGLDVPGFKQFSQAHKARNSTRVYGDTSMVSSV